MTLLLDCHSDVVMDVYRRRADGERDVMRRVHLPRLREGGIGAAVCPVGGDTRGLDPLRAPWESALPCDARRSKIIDAKWLAAA